MTSYAAYFVPMKWN